MSVVVFPFAITFDPLQHQVCVKSWLLFYMVLIDRAGEGGLRRKLRIEKFFILPIIRLQTFVLDIRAGRDHFGAATVRTCDFRRDC